MIEKGDSSVLVLSSLIVPTLSSNAPVNFLQINTPSSNKVFFCQSNDPLSTKYSYHNQFIMLY